MLSTFLKIPYLRMKYRFFPGHAQKFWAQELLNSQGLSSKLGQILAQGKETELPKSSLKSSEVRELFEKNFHRSIEVTDEVFAASMGQVFFVKIDDKKFALKILHPGIKEKLKKEIDNILLLGGYFAKARGFSFDKVIFKRFLTEVFEEETDLTREAQFQEKFFRIFSGDSRFTIPAVISDFSNDAVLCQELIKADLARDLKGFPHYHIFEFFFHALFEHGTLHGDLNDRNWGLINQETVAVYDYGCSQIISERRIQGLRKLLMNQDIVEGFREFGVRLDATWFKGKEQELRDALFNPLLGIIPPSWSYSEELQEKYGDKIKILREYTDPWVLLMMRSLFSLIRIYQDRKLAIPLGQILLPYLKVTEKSIKASQIRIEVQENGNQIVYMALPMTAIDNLEMLMPEKVYSKIQTEGINLAVIIEDVKKSDFAPQDLFNLKIENRSYKVWID
jgi:ABC1 atypical kinase-like domain